MAIGNDELRTASSEPRQIRLFEDPIPPPAARGRNKTRIGPRMLLALILVAGVIYYLGSPGADRPHVANGPGTNQTASSQAATQPSSSNKTALRPTPQPQSPTSPPSQQSPAASRPLEPDATPSPTPTPVPETAKITPKAPAAQMPTAVPETAKITPNAPVAQTPTAAPMANQPSAVPNQPAAVVVKSAVRIRTKPDKNGRVIGTAAKGEQLKEIGRSGGWVQVETRFGTGFVGETLLTPP